MPLREQQISAWTGNVPDEDFIPVTAREAARKGIEYYRMLQCDDGHWAGDYGEMPGVSVLLSILMCFR